MNEILFLAGLSILAKLLEDCRKIEMHKDGARRLKNVHGLYEAFNAHLVISLAVFAFLLSHGVSQDYIYCLLVIVFAGVMSKGVFSWHKPERLAWGDHDARWGLIVPNGCAIAAILIGLFATSPLVTKKSDISAAQEAPKVNVSDSTNK